MASVCDGTHLLGIDLAVTFSWETVRGKHSPLDLFTSCYTGSYSTAFICIGLYICFSVF